MRTKGYLKIYGGIKVLKKTFIFVLMVCFMASTVSAAHIGDTKIVTTDHHKFPNISVRCTESIILIAELQEYGPVPLTLWPIPYKNTWQSLVLRYLDIGVFDSNGKLVFSDTERTKFITAEAKFDSFELSNPGVYTCYIKYAGDLKPCQTQFKIYAR